MKLKRILATLVSTATLLAVSGVASAAPYKLVSWHQRSTSGAHSSLLHKAGAAQGCPGPTYTQPCYSTTGSPGGIWASGPTGAVAVVSAAGQPTWDWNGTTLTMTGLLWAAGSIGSNPNGTIVISDKVSNLTITPGTSTSTASVYDCIEGTFLDSVNANGCLNVDQGGDGITQSSAVYNVGASANCVNRTVAGDDFLTGNTRGVMDAVAGGGCDAIDGGYNLWAIVPNPRFLILSNHPLVPLAGITNDGCYMFGRAGTGTACASDALLSGVSYMILAPDVDTDLDGVVDALDNCTALANATQVDSDADGVGNRCDGDMNNNNVTNSQDYVLFRAQLGAPSVAPLYNKADINANAVVNSQDYVLFRGLLGSIPSTVTGLCNGTWPCPANP